MNIAPATAIASDLPGRSGPRLTQRARLKIWWRELDHVLLGLIVLLMAVGCAAIAAASPAGADRLSSDAVTLIEPGNSTPGTDLSLTRALVSSAARVSVRDHRTVF
mgnify:CR=1 FL=1